MSSGEAAVRVVIIDDHKLFADVIRSALEGAGLEVLATPWTAADGFSSVKEHRPEVVLVDIGLPDESGLSLGHRILEEYPTTKVIALTALNDPRTANHAMRLGFHGYLTKDASMREFLAAVDAVLAGQVVLPKALAARMDRGSPEEAHGALLASQLTPREREVLELFVKGAGSAEIAETLSVSPNTVRTHVQSILHKLQVHSRLEAAAFAVKYRLVRLPGDPPLSS